MLDIDRIGVDAAVSILNGLELSGEEGSRLPPQCLEVAAMFGGGIPREIIRARRTLSFAMGGQTNVNSEWAADILIKEELAKWEAHLGEANLSGSDTIHIRQASRAASMALETGSDIIAPIYSSMWDALECCIQIIDPEQLRKSVGYLFYSAADCNMSDGQQVEYRRIVSDLQMVLRLMILIHLCELILCSGRSRKNYESGLLECHRALAEILLYELREEMFGTPPDRLEPVKNRIGL